MSDPDATPPAADGPGTAARTVTVTNPEGLHLRPLTRIAQLAGSFPCEIRLRKGEAVADAKAMIQAMTLAVGPGDEVTVEAEGDRAAEAADAVAALVAAPEG